jgi:serine/threonine protein kinase
MVMRKVGKYEVGRTIGEGTFAKVKFAQNTETGESVAVKVLDKETVLKHKMVDQIKREISIMKLVRHPNVVRLHEVLASRTKIYIILEFVTGGELFDKIVHQGRLSENESRRYFQQLIDAVDFCHSKGVSYRDLKVLVGWGFVSYRVFCMSYQSDGECDWSHGGASMSLIPLGFPLHCLSAYTQN